MSLKQTPLAVGVGRRKVRGLRMDQHQNGVDQYKKGGLCCMHTVNACRSSFLTGS